MKKKLLKLKIIADKTGQSILEYSVVFVAIVSVIVLAVPMFMKSAVNRYYESSGNYINSTATGVDTLAAAIPEKFSRGWGDYTFNQSDNLDVTAPDYEEAISGMGSMKRSGSGGSGGGYTGDGPSV